MKKADKQLLFLAVLGLGLLLGMRGQLPFDVTGTKFLIVCPDGYQSSTALAEYVQQRTNEGYSVSVVTLTNAISAYPPSHLDTSQLLLVTRVEDITTEGEGVSTLWFDGNKYRVSASNYLNPFRILSPPTAPKPVWIWRRTEDAKSITITYDGGQVISFRLPYLSTDWGMPYILKTGNVIYNSTYADSVKRYILSVSAKYVLLVGSCPSFYLRNPLTLGDDVETHFTDQPFGVASPEANPNMLADIYVGRIPARTVPEMDLILNKFIAYEPRQSGKDLIVEGPDTSESSFTALAEAVRNGLITNYGSGNLAEMKLPTAPAVMNAMNQQYDNIIFYCHGGTQVLAVGEGIYKTSLQQMAFYKSTIVIAFACSTADWGKTECIAESFLLDPDSQVCAYIGASTLSYDGWSVIKNYYDRTTTYKTVGANLAQAKNIPLFLERLSHTLFGDPTLTLIPASTPPPPPPPQQYWILALMIGVGAIGLIVVSIR